MRLVLGTLIAAALLTACGEDDDEQPLTDGNPVTECSERWNSSDNAEGHLGIVIPPANRAFVGLYSGPPAEAEILAGPLAQLRLKPGDCVVVPDNGSPADFFVCQPGGWVRAGTPSSRDEADSYVADAKERPNADVVPSGTEAGKVILNEPSAGSARPANPCGGEPDQGTTAQAETTTTAPEPPPPPEPKPAPEPAPTLIGEWAGSGELTGPTGGEVDTYTQQLTIDSLEPGEVAGRISADYEKGGHCGGELRLVSSEGGRYFFEYTETDNPDGCVATSAIFLSLTPEGDLRYRETSASAGVTIRGTLQPA